MLAWEKYWNLVDVVSLCAWYASDCCNVGLNINITSRCSETKLVGSGNEKTHVGLLYKGGHGLS